MEPDDLTEDDCINALHDRTIKKIGWESEEWKDFGPLVIETHDGLKFRISAVKHMRGVIEIKKVEE